MSEEQEGDVLVEMEEMDVHEDDPLVVTVIERTNLPSAMQVDSESKTEVSMTVLGLEPTSDTDTSTLVGETDDRLLDDFSDSQQGNDKPEENILGSSSESDTEEGLVNSETEVLPSMTVQRI